MHTFRSNVAVNQQQRETPRKAPVQKMQHIDWPPLAFLKNGVAI
jgi:hypothetical protein